MRSQTNDAAAPVAIIIGTVAFLVTGAAVAYGESVDVQLGNKTYTLEYSITGGGLIESAAAESNQPYGGRVNSDLGTIFNGCKELGDNPAKGVFRQGRLY